MEIKRYVSIYFFSREMRKDLFNIDLNNSTGGFNFLSSKLTHLKFSSECKKININNRKKIN